MSHLYIPTTTLNFNNIFATENISPASFYKDRGFGYSQFVDVKPNPFRNIILLYNKFPVFDITDNERDNYPMVIRINKNNLTLNSLKVLKEQDGVGVYSYNKTIYLDPLSVQIYFFSEEAMKIALSKSEPSLTTKTVKLYKQFFRKADTSNENCFLWAENILNGIKDAVESTDKYTREDLRINRLKGFAYAYVLGAIKSTSPAISSHLSEVRTLKNNASSLRIDQGKRAQILNLYSSFESSLAAIGKGASRFDLSQGDNIGIIDLHLNQVIDKNLSDPKAADFLVHLINEYCLGCDFYTDLAEDRLKVSMEGALKIKAIIGNKWEGSPYQAYINALLNNVKNGSAFEIGSVDSLSLKSFAAFILKGDDLEKLEDFLVENGIVDFRIAFAIWGAMFGFSKIPKNYFNLLSENGTPEYEMGIYNHIQKAIHYSNITSEAATLPVSLIPVDSIKEDTPWGSSLERLFRKYPGIRQWEEKLQLFIIECGGMNGKFISKVDKTSVEDLGGKVKRVSKATIIEFLKTEFNNQSSLFPIPSVPQTKTMPFYADDCAWDNIKAIVPEDDQKKVKARIEWFQSDWRDPKSKYYGWENPEATINNPSKKPASKRTNLEAITACCKTLTKHKETPDLVVDDIRRVFLQRYNDVTN